MPRVGDSTVSQEQPRTEKECDGGVLSRMKIIGISRSCDGSCYV